MLEFMDISVQQRGAVAVITWNEGENRVNLDSLGRLNEILDELEQLEGPLGIVLTCLLYTSRSRITARILVTTSPTTC